MPVRCFVQLRAPQEKKGQVIGVYGVAANGMRIGSGFTVGFLGAAVGLRTALGLSSTALVVCVLILAVYLAVVARRDRDQAEALVPVNSGAARGNDLTS